MFCPECGAEYRPGFTICADCDVALVHELADDGEPADDEHNGDSDGGPDGSVAAPHGGLALLAEVANHHEAAAIADRFEQESVPYVLQYGSAMSQVEGKRLFNRRSSGWRGLLWVDAGELARARPLLIQALEDQHNEAARAEELAATDSEED